MEDAQGMASIYLSAHQDTYRDLHEPALIIAGCFAAVAVVLSIILIFQHLRSYTNPAEQKWIVAIIFMVPVYACESIISLWNPRFSLVCDILRNCYEAIALYSFGSCLVACLGGERRVIELLENESRKQLSKPFLEGADEKCGSQQRSLCNFFIQPHVLGKNLFTIVKFGLVQYMILKTVFAFLAFLLELFGVYGDGEFKWYYGVTGNNTIKDMVFGCRMENVETNKGQHPSGIIGLANTSLSLVSQLHVTQFSYCVVANDTTNESHGWIRFGLAAVISGASTPLFPNKHGLHFIKFEGISLTGDWLLNISMEPFAVTEDGTTGFMIDSGTTITMLHANAHDVLLDSIRRYKGEGGMADHDKVFDLCFDDLLDAPEIEFHFKSGASIPLSNDNAWIENSVGVWCLAIERTYGVSILGMRQQQNMNIGYDYSVDQVAFTYAYTCPEDLF